MSAHDDSSSPRAGREAPVALPASLSLPWGLRDGVYAEDREAARSVGVEPLRFTIGAGLAVRQGEFYDAAGAVVGLLEMGTGDLRMGVHPFYMRISPGIAKVLAVMLGRFAETGTVAGRMPNDECRMTNAEADADADAGGEGRES